MTVRMRKFAAFAFSVCMSFFSLFAQAGRPAVSSVPGVGSGSSGMVVYNADFAKGEELFRLNRPAESIPYFEKAIASDTVDPAVYVYLGVAYYQTGDFSKSLAVCVQGLAKESADKKVLAYNAGNSCYAMGNYMRADASYAIAIQEDENFAPAYLNRANAQLKLDHLEDARGNYTKYLELEPESAQRGSIERLVLLLEAEIELRAKQRPERINPDDFVANEHPELPAVPEKVEVDIPLERQPEPVSAEIVPAEYVHAPDIPFDQLTTTDERAVPREIADAPALPSAVIKPIYSGEKVSATEPDEIPKSNIKEESPRAEIVSAPESDIPSPEAPQPPASERSEKITAPESDIPVPLQKTPDVPVLEKVEP